VTSFIAAKKAAGATSVNFVLKGTMTTPNFAVASFNSREATSNQPQLAVS